MSDKSDSFAAKQTVVISESFSETLSSMHTNEEEEKPNDNQSNTLPESAEGQDEDLEVNPSLDEESLEERSLDEESLEEGSLEKESFGEGSEEIQSAKRKIRRGFTNLHEPVFERNPKKRTNLAKKVGSSIISKAKIFNLRTGAEVHVKARYSGSRKEPYIFTYGSDFAIENEQNNGSLSTKG